LPLTIVEPLTPTGLRTYTGTCDRDFAVADAKYKELEPGKWPHADLYQLLAYCVSLGLPAGLLIYANERPFESHTVERAGVNLEVIGIEMSDEPHRLETRVRRAARRLAKQAAELRTRYKAAS
jgi:5-methylcytosine-specific restriction enzyme subunit McrC